MKTREKLEIRKEAVDALKLLKETYTYNELSRNLEISMPVIARYISGENLPNLKRAKKILEFFNRGFDLKKTMEKCSKKGVFGLIDITDIILDRQVVRKIAELAIEKFRNVKIDKIFTVASDGIIIADAIAERTGIPFVYAKTMKESGVSDFYEASIVLKPSANIRTLYIPKKWIRKGERLLFVDDVLRSGSTLLCSYELVKKANARLIGAFLIFANRKVSKELESKVGIKIASVQFF
ncbi:MAG: phosphoribosyltransferase family protein [Candidatus Parvarchaeota archaeon]|nr:phosphoribosyltransferase family protein [Candidatus Jingweiarchaeum tengchongense]MCW1304921.1 phosphoribosyltransferase family protein [Candidatus Jingweiarchaeum tengchongense]